LIVKKTKIISRPEPSVAFIIMLQERLWGLALGLFLGIPAGGAIAYYVMSWG
jgi:hypothetical protein